MIRQNHLIRQNHSPDWTTLFRVFGHIGLLSFGGPAAQIALLQRCLVDERRWLSEQQFLNALGFCMLLPGPEAMQLATYAGWRLRGVMGGLLAGLLFVLPSAAIIVILGILYVKFADVPLMNGLFLGIKATVLIIVMEALFKVAKRSLHGYQHIGIAVLAFVALFFLALPYPLVVAFAALYGFCLFQKNSKTIERQSERQSQKFSFARTCGSIVLWLGIWSMPFLAMAYSDHGVLHDIGVFFSKLAVVTFGGAYAVLAYMSQDVITQFGWLDAGEMMDGLGLAETTPGPLILVTEFVGFLAAYREGGLLLGITGAFIALWVTFVPCFLWIFTGAPYIEWVAAQPRLKGALSAITAAVVGVIFNLSLWFGLHVLFAEVTATKAGVFTLWLPAWDSINIQVLVLALCSAIALLRWRWSVPRVLGVSAVLGLILTF